MSGGFSWWHWLIVAAVVLVLFGARRLPDAARGLGRSMRILKSEVSAMSSDRPTVDAEVTDPPVAAATPIRTPASEPLDRR